MGQTVNTVPIKERIKVGKKRIKEALENRDIIQFNSCIGQFLKLQKLSEAKEVLMECPTDFILAANPDIPIFSEKLKRHIVLGKDIKWSVLADTVQRTSIVKEMEYLGRDREEAPAKNADMVEEETAV